MRAQPGDVGVDEDAAQAERDNEHEADHRPGRRGEPPDGRFLDAAGQGQGEAGGDVDEGDEAESGGGADERDDEEGDEEGAGDGAQRVGREQQAGVGAHMSLGVGDEGGGGGEGQAQHERRRQHHDHHRQHKRLDQAAVGRCEREDSWSGVADDSDHAQQDEQGDDDLAEGQQVDRADARAQEGEGARAQGEPDQEDGQNRREDVGGVARARGEQTRPQDLIAERGQAGHVRDDQRQPNARALAAGRSAVRWRFRCGCRRQGTGVHGRPAPEAVEQEGDEARRRRAAGAHPQRSTQPQQLDQHEAGHQRPEVAPNVLAA